MFNIRATLQSEIFVALIFEKDLKQHFAFKVFNILVGINQKIKLSNIIFMAGNIFVKSQ